MTNTGPLEASNRTLSVQSLATKFAWMLFALGSLLFLFFAWPAIRGELGSIFAEVQPEQIRDFTLVSYFISWIVAMFVDLHIQKSVYHSAPSSDHLILKGSAVAVTLFVLAVTLIWSRASSSNLALALDLFFITNILAWLQTKRLVRPIIETSRRFYKKEPEDRPRLAQLDVLAAYISGKWQWQRFIWMLIIIIVLNVLTFSSAPEALAKSFHRALPSVLELRISSLLPDLTILLFVITAEAWSWTQRIVTAVKAGKLNNRLISDHPRLAEYMNQFFEQQFKAVNYLMIAHAAALLATLTLVKEYLASLKSPTGPVNCALVDPKDVGFFIALFAWGLALAILGYIMLSIARDQVMSTIMLDSQKTLDHKLSYLVWSFCAVLSALLLLSGVLTLAGRVSGVGTAW